MKEFFKNLIIKIFSRQVRQILKKHKPLVVAVVGSVGKTSTKIAVATVLSQKYRVRYQHGNYNTPISVPFVFLGRELPSLKNPFAWFFAWYKGQTIVHGKFPYDIVVIELGTDKPGDIIEFKNSLKVDIAVVSAISEEHMEFFENLEAVAREELSVSKFSKSLVINSDDVQQEFIDMYIEDNKEIRSYGFDHSEYKITASRLKNHFFKLNVGLGGDDFVSAEVPLVAKHSLRSYAAAVAVGDILEMKPESIKKGLDKIKPPAGRMQILEAKENSIIIDDSYNSSPLALEAAVSAFYDMNSTKKIAVLGMMNELGVFSKLAHEKIGKLCDPKKIDLLITIGKDANTFLAGSAEENGCSVIRTNSPIKAGKVALQNLSTDTIILVKGSQNGVFSEEAVKQLLANPADKSRLVRQSEFWFTRKRAQFNDFVE